MKALSKVYNTAKQFSCDNKIAPPKLTIKMNLRELFTVSEM